MTSFHEAAKNGHLDRLREATKRDSNKADEMGMTPTLLAAYYGKVEALRLLVSRGGDPDKCDMQGYTALHLGAMAGHQVVIEFLIAFGCNYWALNNDYQTATQLAIQSGKQNVADILDDAAARQAAANRKVVHKTKEKAVKDADERVKALAKKMRDEEKKRKEEEKKMKKRKDSQKPTGGATPNIYAPPEEQDDQDDEPAPGPESPFWIPKMNPSSMTSLPTPGNNADVEEETLNILDNAVNVGDQTSAPTDSFPRHSVTSDGTDSSVPGHKWEEDVEIALDDEVDATTSALEIFLSVNDLQDYLPVFFEEDIDMKALVLLTDQDIIGLQLPLGPRKKLQQAIRKRNETFKFPGMLLDSAI